MAKNDREKQEVKASDSGRVEDLLPELEKKEPEVEKAPEVEKVPEPGINVREKENASDGAPVPKPNRPACPQCGSTHIGVASGMRYCHGCKSSWV
jgi:hypothetical protein